MAHTRRPHGRPPAEVGIDGLDSELNGTGLDARGRRWHLRGAPPGATVLAVGKPKAGIRVGLVTAPPDGVTPPCPAFGTCGGCQYQELPLARQREEKARALAALLAPLGGVDHGLVGAEAGYGWRNKVELSVGVERYATRAEIDLGVPIERRGRWFGFHAMGSWDRVVDLDGCPVTEPALGAVWTKVRADVLASPWPAWDPLTHTGFWRHVVLRTGVGGEVLAAVHTNGGDAEQAAWLRGHAPAWGVGGAVWIENSRPADTAQGTLREVLCGEPFVEQRLDHLRYRLGPSAFFQANREGAELLARVVGHWVGGGAGIGTPLDGPELSPTGAPAATLLDLYCGTGLFGLYGARFAAEVVGVELNPHAVADANENAARNGIPNARFLAGDVAALLPGLPRGRPLVVVVDPPRVGLHPDALRTVAGLPADVLIYVACRASSLLRDGQRLREAGWRCTDRVALDLFPQTAHVEVASRWVREV